MSDSRVHLVALVLVAGLGGGLACDAGESLSDEELREFRQASARVQALCADPKPGARLDARLEAPVNRLFELAKQDPEREYDADPTNDPEISDRGTPTQDLRYLAGLLSGVEVRPRRECSRPLAARMQRALRDIE